MNVIDRSILFPVKLFLSMKILFLLLSFAQTPVAVAQDSLEAGGDKSEIRYGSPCVYSYTSFDGGRPARSRNLTAIMLTAEDENLIVIDYGVFPYFPPISSVQVSGSLQVKEYDGQLGVRHFYHSFPSPVLNSGQIFLTKDFERVSRVMFLNFYSVFSTVPSFSLSLSCRSCMESTNPLDLCVRSGSDGRKRGMEN